MAALPVTGLSLCQEWTVAALNDPQCPIALRASWRALRTILPAVCTVVGSKASTGITPGQCHLISTLTLQAFLAAVPSLSQRGRRSDGQALDPLQCTRFHTLGSRDVDCSELLPHSIVVDTPLLHDLDDTLAVDNCAVALFDVSLCLELEALGDVVYTGASTGMPKGTIR